MNVLQVCSAPGFGGGERHVSELARELIRRGHVVHLAVRPAARIRESLHDAPVRWHEIALRHPLDLLSVAKLARVLRESRIDVLHAHVARDWVLCGLASKRAPVRLFLTRHHGRPMHGNALYAWAIGGVVKILAVSASVRERVSAAFPKLAARVVIIPNWVDPTECGSLARDAARECLGVTRRLALAVIGEITPLKRQDLFLLAASDLVHRRGLDDVEFFVVGASGARGAAYERQLRALVRQHNLSARVFFPGQVQNLPALLRAFDIVAAPSDDEGFSLAIAESMAAGRAVVASRVGGLAELVTDGTNGLLTIPGSAESLADALARLAEDEALRTRLGAAAREDAARRFNRERLVGTIENLYRSGSGDAVTSGRPPSAIRNP